MGFDDLPAQPPLYPAEAEAYARRAIELSRQAADGCEVDLDVAYGEDYWQRMDIYRSPVAGGDVPVLLFVHGGGWTNGYKEWMGLLAPAITALPAVFVSVSHRLAPEHRFPEPFDDCLNALAWVHRNIDRYGGSPERLFVGGHSSGGHLFSLVTLRRDAQRAAGLPDDVVQACFPLSSRFDMVFDDPEPGSTEHRHKSMLFAGDDDMVSASPLHQVKGNRVPFLIAYGDHDIPALIDGGQQMYKALAEAGTPVDLIELDGHDHFDTALETRHADNPWTLAVGACMRDGMHNRSGRGSSDDRHSDRDRPRRIP